MNKNNLRTVKLGLSGELFYEGQHIIYVYNDDWERKQTLAKFLNQGLVENEKILYLVDDISVDEMNEELQKMDVNTANTAFNMTKAHYTHCPDNYFSPKFMLGMVGEFYDKAIDEGYVGARGAGEMSWALIENRTTVPDLLHYEAQLNNILIEYPLTSVCQYDARRFDGALIMDMLSVHPIMIVRGQMVKNPTYVKPEIFLKEYEERMKRDQIIEN